MRAVAVARAALRALAFVWFVVALAALPAAAQDPGGGERILSFDSRIEVDRDGELTVTETIEVVVRGRQIRRGIFRDIPLDRAAGYGRTVSDLDILSVERDGGEEPYRTERDGARLRIVIGDADRTLADGVHTYVLRYRIDQQIGFFPDYDEVYWNATGDEWAFTIEEATASVVLPAGTEVLSTAVYTGTPGSRAHDATIARDGDGAVVFTTGAPLPPGQGMTVAVAFPKGVVAEPSALTLALRELMPAIVGGIGTLLVLGYYVWAWRRVGIDPEPGPLIPVYAPTLPPAAMRYLDTGYDAGCLTAALLEAATRGHLHIDEPERGAVTLERQRGRKELSPETAAALAVALPGEAATLTLSGSGNTKLAKAGQTLSRKLGETYGKAYRRNNYLWLVPGLALTVLVWLVTASTAPTADDAIVAPIITLVATGFVYGFGVVALDAWRSGFRGRLRDLGRGLAYTAMTLMAFVFWAAGVLIYLGSVGFAATVLLVAVVVVNLVFFRLLPAPTPLGRRALDEIAGTRLYLTVAEADRLRFHNPPDRTPEHFEAMLPYAVALGVETEWTDQFRDVLARATDPAKAAAAMQPSWYSGSRSAGDIGGISTGVSRTITHSISQGMAALAAASARASGGGGGSSGGGSSGGGGGGGGGGGW